MIRCHRAIVMARSIDLVQLNTEYHRWEALNVFIFNNSSSLPRYITPHYKSCAFSSHSSSDDLAFNRRSRRLDISFRLRTMVLSGDRSLTISVSPCDIVASSKAGFSMILIGLCTITEWVDIII